MPSDRVARDDLVRLYADPDLAGIRAEDLGDRRFEDGPPPAALDPSDAPERPSDRPPDPRG